MNCDDIPLSELHADELDADAVDSARAHLADCANCRALLAAMALVDEATAALPQGEPSRAMAIRVLERAEGLTRIVREADVPDVMTLGELARWLRVEADALEREDPPGFELGGQRRYRKAAILDWLATREQRGLRVI